MNITQSKEGSKLTIGLEGRLDTTTAPQLEAELKSARIIDEAQLDADIVNVGSVVTLEMKGTGSLLKYKIVGSAETDPANNKISNESPVGKAVLGHRKGETVEVVTPGGIRFFIIKEIGR